MDIGKTGPRALIALLLSNLPALAGTPVIYFSSYNNNTIYTGDANGVATVFVNSGLNGPGGLAWDSAGNLYTANWNNGIISKITPQGAVSNYASGFQNPWGLAFDAAGNLYVSNAAGGSGTTISRIAPTSPVTITTFASGLSQPMGLAFDANGLLYAANFASKSIARIASNGSVSPFATFSGSQNPLGLTFDSNGLLYATVQAGGTNSYVAQISTLGAVTTFAPITANPYGLHSDSLNNLYVGANLAPVANSEILRIAPNAGVSIFVQPPLVAATDVISAFVFNSSWNGSVGNWSEGPKWSPAPTVPNNGQSPFNVNISAGSVALDINPTISSLNISSGGSLTGAGNITFSTASITGAYNITGSTTVNTSLTFGGANQSAGKIAGPGTLQVNAGTVLTSDRVSITGAWTINGIHITRPSNSVAHVGPLSFAGAVNNWTGLLDLSTNSLIVTGGSGTDLRNQIAQGAALGQWNGTGGINSSAAHASLQTSTGTALACASGAEYSVFTQKTSFLGQSYALTDTLILYTLAGDTNMDQSVTFADFLQLQNHYNQSNTDWQGGDFNYDGNTTFADFLILQNNYNKSFPAGPILPAASSNSSGVPEPANLILISLGIATIFSTRHRQTRPSP